LSIWTVLGATPVPIFWIFVLCQFVWRPITAADASVGKRSLKWEGFVEKVGFEPGVKE